jgi:hypothetical protein
MRSETFADPSLDILLRRPRPGDAEPELGLRSPPRPPDFTAGFATSIFSGTEDEKPTSVSSRPNVASNRRATAAGLSVGSLLYLVLVGLVAIMTIGVFFGASFLLLTRPAKEMKADSGAGDRVPSRPYGDDMRASREAPPIPRELAAPDSAAIAALPDSPLAQSAAVAETAAPQQKAAQGSPLAPPSGEPPSRTALEPEPVSSSSAFPAPAAPSVSPPPSSTAGGGRPGGAKRPTRFGPSDHARAEPRHPHSRSGHSARSHTPPQARQTSPIDELLTRLSGQPKPAARTLTPPPADQPGPFSQRVGNK